MAYEFELDASFLPRPGWTRLERVYVLLDCGVQLSNPPYFRGQDATTWYVDLVSVTASSHLFTIRDLYIDAIIPTDGRYYRMLDLDEYGEALDTGAISLRGTVDGLVRWQRFLDTYLHTARFPANEWTDFPPAAIAPLVALDAPLRSLTF